MYGLINSALQDMVVTHFGEEKWQHIHAHSGVPNDSFLTMRHYDDAITYQLAGAASEVLGAPLDDCLEMFGQHWVEAIATRNFEALMDATGNTTISFLHNLNGLHDRISSTFLDYVPPAFDIETIDSTSGIYRVHYHSERKSLTPFVTGLLRGLAKHFDDAIEIVSIKIDDSGSGTYSILEIKIQ